MRSLLLHPASQDDTLTEIILVELVTKLIMLMRFVLEKLRDADNHTIHVQMIRMLR